MTRTFIKDKRIGNFILKQSQSYWKRIQYSKKFYMMNFQFELWVCNG